MKSKFSIFILLAGLAVYVRAQSAPRAGNAPLQPPTGAPGQPPETPGQPPIPSQPPVPGQPPTPGQPPANPGQPPEVPGQPPIPGQPPVPGQPMPGGPTNKWDYSTNSVETNYWQKPVIIPPTNLR
jgi:hypothetical protein